MSEALRMAGFAVIAALCAMVIKSAHREMGRAVSLAAGLMLFFFAAGPLGSAAELLKNLSQESGLGENTLELMVKFVAMGYITEFAVQACRDAGEEGLAAKAGLCGKVVLMGQTLPLVLEIGRTAFSLVP